MTRRKRVELTDEIVRCARTVRTALWGDWRIGLLLADEVASLEALLSAVDALDAYGPAEIVGGRGAFVHGSPETSETSAHLMSPRTSSIRRLVIDEVAVGMWQRGLTGLTCRELEGRLKRPHTTVSSALNWAINAGWLMDSGFRRDATPGHPAVVWRLTPAALAKRGER